MENLILPAFLLIAYLAIVYPSLKRRRDERALQAALTEGDEVVMNSGLHGFITALDTDVAYIEVSDGVELKYTRASIARRLTESHDE